MSILPIGLSMILMNTAPFWSVLFGKWINGASISAVQIMLILGSFTGVVIVAISKMVVKPELDDIDVIVTPESQIEDTSSPYIFGIITGICSGMSFSLLGVATRQLQKIHPSSMLFSYSIFGIVVTLFILTIESLITWSPWRFLDYTGAQYGWMILASFV
jgi:drug/metabolite transporter (DMT)-like permease